MILHFGNSDQCYIRNHSDQYQPSESQEIQWVSHHLGCGAGAPDGEGDSSKIPVMVQEIYLSYSSSLCILAFAHT